MKNDCTFKKQNLGFSGFTLIELLVVIAIIALLLSVLIPALGKVKDAARDAMCLSNFKQCGVAMNTYAQANKQRIPGAAGATFWMLAYAPYVGTDLTNLNNFDLYGKIAVFNCARYPVKEQVVDYLNSSWTKNLDGSGSIGTVSINDYKNPSSKIHMADYETTNGRPNSATGGADYPSPATAAQLVWNQRTLSSASAVLDVYMPVQLPGGNPPTVIPVGLDPVTGNVKAPDANGNIPGFQDRRVAINRHKKNGANVLYLDGHSAWLASKDNVAALWVRK